MMNTEKIQYLEQVATRCRINVARMLRASGHGHIGGAFSSMEIVTALYFHKMRIKPDEPNWEARDRFLLSAGHKSMVQYAVLAERGYFPKDVLDTYGQIHSIIPGHPCMHKLPGIEANTGALGHGLAIALGMAMGLKLDGSDSKVYTILGDGELAEGSNWEAAAAAAHHKADNLVAFVDNNGLQISGKVSEVMDYSPIAERFRIFGWAVREIDGNNMKEVVEALDAVPFETGKPSMIIAHTVKAKGLKQGENQVSYHYWNPTVADCDALERDLLEVLDLEDEKYE